MHGSPKDELPVKASDVETTPSQPQNAEPTLMEYYMKLIFCIVGLQVSYITWGVLQVREVFMCPMYGSDVFVSGTDYDTVL